MPVELNTQSQFAAFAAEVARELGTHCRTAPTPEYDHMLSHVIIDGEGRALSLRQHDSDQPARLKVYAALPDDTQVAMPRIGVTATSARHVAREITRRLYPMHAEASQRAAELTALKMAEARDRRAVSDAVAGALPGARVEENERTTRVIWQRPAPPGGHVGPGQRDSVCVYVGASGEWVSADVSGRPHAILAMLAVFGGIQGG
ncbi:hypothetical protein [Streptomyces sp. NPDC095817]|uniref:hypothetical protein n=1 Tax=Streptomyces sp. NPDC095817 TaxID=3155082 RepID=UPI00332717F4